MRVFELLLLDFYVFGRRGLLILRQSWALLFSLLYYSLVSDDVRRSSCHFPHLVLQVLAATLVPQGTGLLPVFVQLDFSVFFLQSVVFQLAYVIVLDHSLYFLV